MERSHKDPGCVVLKCTYSRLFKRMKVLCTLLHPSSRVVVLLEEPQTLTLTVYRNLK